MEQDPASPCVNAVKLFLGLFKTNSTRFLCVNASCMVSAINYALFQGTENKILLSAASTFNAYRGCMHHNVDLRSFNILSNDCSYQQQSIHNYCQLVSGDGLALYCNYEFLVPVQRNVKMLHSSSVMSSCFYAHLKEFANYGRNFREVYIVNFS